MPRQIGLPCRAPLLLLAALACVPRPASPASGLQEAGSGQQEGGGDDAPQWAAGGEWSRSRHDLSFVSVHNHKLSTLLGTILAHQFTIPEAQLHRSLVYTGSNHRLRRVVHDLMTGRRVVRIGAVGGSVCWGWKASAVGVTDWFSLFSNWIVSAGRGGGRGGAAVAASGSGGDSLVMCPNVCVWKALGRGRG